MNTFSQTISNFKNEKKQNEKKIKKKDFFIFPRKRFFKKKTEGRERNTFSILRDFTGNFTGIDLKKYVANK